MYHLLSAVLNWLKLVYGLFETEEPAPYIEFLPRPDPSQEGIKCTKAKEQLRPYCPNIYTVIEGMQAKRAKSQGQAGPGRAKC